MIYDLVIIGGGINGVGIALDAASRGLNVLLCEQNDLGSGTSSKSSKLIHGGLRYLEQYAFGLVKESLNEREILLQNAGHFVQPLRFIIPYDKSHRPDWMLRLGLYCYDFLSYKSTLNKSKKIKIDNTYPINPFIKTGFQYYDCTVDDARLVISLARLAKSLGVKILTQTPCICAKSIENNIWSVTLKPHAQDQEINIKARVLINATGPWLNDTLSQVLKKNSLHQMRKVKGSHILVPKLYNGNQAYLLQNTDSRVVFVIPFLKQFTMIGTTDLPYDGDPNDVQIDEIEIQYLCKVVNHYFKNSINPSHVYSSWSGVRALWDDGTTNLSNMTRDCKIETLLDANHPPLINIFGGKITTYRSLSEKVLNSLKSVFIKLAHSNTKHMKLPGAIAHTAFPTFLTALKETYSQMPIDYLERLVMNYGLDVYAILHNCKKMSDLGQDFGHGLTEKEVVFLLENEFAQTAEDILLRRTKLGLCFQPNQVEKLNDWIQNRQLFRFELDKAILKNQ